MPFRFVYRTAMISLRSLAGYTAQRYLSAVRYPNVDGIVEPVPVLIVDDIVELLVMKTKTYKHKNSI